MNDYFQSLPDERLLALCIAGEARGERPSGMIAVANVVRNRVCAVGWPNSYKEVILQPYQFSCFNDLDPNADFLRRFDFNGRQGRFFIWIARGIMSGMISDFVGGATHYHSSRIQKPKTWGDSLEPIAEIGNHIFYKKAK